MSQLCTSRRSRSGGQAHGLRATRAPRRVADAWKAKPAKGVCLADLVEEPLVADLDGLPRGVVSLEGDSRFLARHGYFRHHERSEMLAKQPGTVRDARHLELVDQALSHVVAGRIAIATREGSGELIDHGLNLLLVGSAGFLVSAAASTEGGRKANESDGEFASSHDRGSLSAAGGPPCH